MLMGGGKGKKEETYITTPLISTEAWRQSAVQNLFLRKRSREASTVLQGSSADGILPQSVPCEMWRRFKKSKGIPSRPKRWISLGIHSNTAVNLVQISALRFMMSIKDKRTEASKIQIMNHTLTAGRKIALGSIYQAQMCISAWLFSQLFPPACMRHLNFGHTFTNTTLCSQMIYYLLTQNHSDHGMFICVCGIRDGWVRREGGLILVSKQLDSADGTELWNPW